MKPVAFNYDDYLALKAENERLKAELDAPNRRAQPENEPLTLREQWTEVASDNTDCVLTYADGLYCVTDVKGRVVCEFMRVEKEASNER